MHKFQVSVKWGSDILYTRVFSAPVIVVVGEGGDIPLPVPTFTLVSSTKDIVTVGDEQLGGSPLIKEVEGFTFEVSLISEPKVASASWETAPIASQGLSAFLHACLLAVFLLFTPDLLPSEDGEMSTEMLYNLRAQLQAVAEKEPELVPSAVESNVATGEEVKPETSVSQAPGANLKSPQGGPSVSGKGSPSMSREDAIRDAQDFGMVSLLGTLPGAKEGSVWGSTGLESGVGDFGDGIWGGSGNDLELSGPGENGGGPFQGTFLKSLTVCTVEPCSGLSRGHLPPGYNPTGPKAPRQGPIEMSGRIPPEVIQRVVRQSFGRFRGCYEAALRTNPSLSGRVAVAFVVGRDGSVTSAQSAGSDMPEVAACVVKQFYGLSFPAPDGGVVRVTYPIVFSAK